jgi:WD40 repeat protein
LDSPSVPAARCVFSPTEALLAFSSETVLGPANRQYCVRLWNADTHQFARRFLLSGKCAGLAFSADGITLVTSTFDPESATQPLEGQLTLWRISDGAKLAEFPAPQSSATTGTQFAANRNLTLAAVAPDETLRLVELPTGKERWSAKTENDLFTALAFSPDGTVLATADGYANASIRFWDVGSGKQLGPPLTNHAVWAGALVFWPDGKTLASASADQTIRLWDVSDFTSVRPLGRALRGDQHELRSLALLPDNRTLVSGDKNGRVLVWDAAAARREYLPTALPVALGAWYSTTNGQSVLTIDRQGQAARWHGDDFQEKQPLLELGTNVFGACFSEDGRLLACGSHTGLVQVVDLLERTVVRSWKVGTNRVKPWRFLRHGQELITRHPSDGTASVWDLSTGQLMQSWRYPSYAFGRAISPDERLFIHLGYGGILGDLATGSQTNLNLDIRQARDAAFSPDGTILAAASWLGFARLWEFPTLREIRTLGGVLINYNSLAFSPDGARLATAGSGQEAMKLWDLQSGLELLTLEGRGSLFEQTAFSPDGNLLGSMNRQGILHLWRAPSWAEIEAAERTALDKPARP